MDLERRRVVDVLAVRTADAVAAWLAAYPDIEIISRDRHGPYAKAVRRGAPQATQVADRFHLVLNLRGAVQQELSRLRPFLGVSYSPVAVPPNGGAPAVIAPPRRASVVVEDQHQILQQRRALHLDRFQLVKRLQAAGHTAQAIECSTKSGVGVGWQKCLQPHPSSD